MFEFLRTCSRTLRFFLLVAGMLFCACESPPLGVMAPTTEAGVLLDAHLEYGFSRVRGRAMAMDTFVSIVLFVPPADMDMGKKAILSAFSAINSVEARFSRHIIDSEISQLNSKGYPGPVPVSLELFSLLKVAGAQLENTRKRFDPTVGALLEAWDFTGEKPKLPSSDVLDKALATVGFDGIIFDKKARTIAFSRRGTVIDLGGFAKGYAIDRAIESLVQDRVNSALVNAGGDMRALGKKPSGHSWNIGLRDPSDLSRLLGTFPLRDGEAVATSGDYERFYEIKGKRYHHLLDPSTGRPGRESRSVTVVTSSAALADLGATALFIAGPKGLKALDKQGTPALVVDPKGVSHGTKEFNLRFLVEGQK